MKILHLPLMAKWYEMIERGEKLEEYREDKPFWRKRLMECFRNDKNGCADDIFPKCRQCFCTYGASKPGKFKKFDAVKFRYGYTKRTMTFRIKNIRFGKGKREWGAWYDDVFIPNGGAWVAYPGDYSIGDLIDFLICPVIRTELIEWVVIYSAFKSGESRKWRSKELIDALYLACVQLKQEGEILCKR